MKKISYLFLICMLCLTACSQTNKPTNTRTTLTYGTTAYGVAMGNAGLDPHNSYMGWSTLRYGIGETLFKFNESMALEPWLAESYEQIDEYTVKITLKENLTFSNGNPVTGASVEKCFNRLIDSHDRAPSDLDIKEITSDGLDIYITTNNPAPALLNYLSDPYGAIIDVDAGVDDDYNVTGTGPYKATIVSETEISLVINENYWGNKPTIDNIIVKSITDGDTLTLALQSGEIDIAQGLPYTSLELFNQDDYKISSTSTSRLYQVAFNFDGNFTNDLNVRKAIAMAIDKEQFTNILLNGNGTSAKAAFPSNFSFGNEAVDALTYDIEAAKNLLLQAGYIDEDGDGYLEKDGQTLTIRWLTYTSRQELPLLAEYAQAALKDIGILVEVNATDNHYAVLESGEYDVYASAFVAAPTGDPQYFFTTHVLENSSYNTGNYFNPEIEKLVETLSNEFDTSKRSDLAIQLQQIILDDCAYLFVSHLKMSFVMKSYVDGFTAHPSDYYEITSDISINAE